MVTSFPGRLSIQSFSCWNLAYSILEQVIAPPDQTATWSVKLHRRLLLNAEPKYTQARRPGLFPSVSVQALNAIRLLRLFINEPGVVRSGALTLLIVLAQQLDYIKNNIKPITPNNFYSKVSY